MNEEQMLAAVGRATAAWNADDWEGMAREYRPDAEVTPPHGWLEGEDSHGWEEIHRQFARLKDSWSNESLEVVETRAEGSNPFVRFRRLTEGETSGIKVESDVFCAFRFDEERVTHHSFHFDRAEALAGAGMEVTG